MFIKRVNLHWWVIWILNEENGGDHRRGQEKCLGFIFWSLMELDDILRQTIQEHVLGEESLFNQKQLSFMNEIIRPMLERIRYHFLQHVDEGTSGEHGEHGEHELPNATHGKTVRFTSSRLDRLPEWVLFYIKEIIVENRVWNMLQDCVKPMCRAVATFFNEEISNQEYWT